MSFKNFLIAMLFVPAVQVAAKDTSGTQAQSIYDIRLEPMQETTTQTVSALKDYKGKVMLIVNVASKCGFTKQYDALEAVNQKYKDKGLVIIGVPANDFKSQEPGTHEDILQFCRSKYHVTFPLAAKVHVIGPEKAPLYKHLTEGDAPFPGEVAWNFEKFLVSRDGRVVGRFRSKVTPDSPELTEAIEKELAAK